jgi:uncharacterized protein YdeI (YjbR/CyaY-like superfamily)
MPASVLKCILMKRRSSRATFARNKKLGEFFGSLSYTHQKEYVRWIESAKKEETRRARILKTTEMLGRKIKHL